MYSPHFVQRIVYGALRVTVICEFFGPCRFRRLILDGSKSGGKYLFSTLRSDILAGNR